VSIVGNSYLVPLVKGKSDLLRMPQELANDLGMQGPLTATAIMPSGRKLPIRLNTTDRTVVGLGPWLKTCENEDIRSVRFEILSDNPFTFAVDFSNQAPDLTGTTEHANICRPEHGLYLGGKLLPEFYELIRTTEAMAVEECDLLRHVFICGSTGSGKTVLAKCFIEEAAQRHIPVIAIDLKGDISSMSILVSGEDPAGLVAWVPPKKDESQEARAAAAAAQHKANLERWGLSHKDIDHLRKEVAINVFTPRSNAGFRLALSAFVEPPADLEKLIDKDPDSFENIIQFMAETFVSRLALNRKKADKAKGYIYEIIKTCWTRGVSLRGYNGIKQVLDEVRLGHLGIGQIGGMQTDEFISQKDREDISAAINTLLTGAQRLWFQGFPLDIESLINPDNYDGRTPVTIVYIQHLGFQDQAYVVGYIAYLIWFWMRRHGGADEPRLVFYIDEIGGGGGKEAFFPSVATSPSKPALNSLLRQGRAFGVCCMFATQSPGDIDYRAMGQCGTWAVGQLRKQRERKKIEEGAGTAELDFELASQHIANFEAGQFWINTPSLASAIFEERWLMHWHHALSPEEVERLKENYEKESYVLFEEVEKSLRAKKPSTAKNLLESIINGYRFSVLCAKAYLQLGRVLYDMGDYGNAIKKLEDMIRYRMEAEEVGEAYFLIGKCKEQQGCFSDAVEEFAKVAESGASEDVKENALSHEQYCKNRASWLELTEVQKFFWWIVGRKPNDKILTRLQIKDKDLLEEQFEAILQEQDFSIPDPIDFQELVEVGKKADAEQLEKNAEQVKAERWARDQAPKIEALLKEGALMEASLACKRTIQRLQDAHALAPPSVISVIEKCNRHGEEKSRDLNKKLVMLDARQFEFEIANLFRLKGYESFPTRLTGDDGVDVFASKDNEKVIIQCKRWRHPVGRNKVDELAGVKARYGIQRAILATTSSFSEGAKEAARKNRIELWDFSRIRQEWLMVFTESHN